MKTLIRCVTFLLVSGVSAAQTPPWTVTVTPTLNPLPLGMCGAVHLTLLDPATRDVPRNPQGYRINMADFDMSVSGGTSAAGHQIDSTHFAACGCQGGAAGSTVTVTARYPAQSLPVASRVRGVSIQQSATLTLALPKGAVNPPPCATLTAGTASSGIVSGATGAGAASTGGAARAGSAGAAGGNSAGAVQPGNAARIPSPAVVPVNPSRVDAGQTGPGEVGLAWTPIPDASFYVVFGPGLTPGGHRVENQTDPRYAGTPFPPQVTLVARNVPAGTQEWLVASYYSPGNISTPASQFARASVNVSAPASATAPSSPPASTPAAPPAPASASGRYLVTVTGLRAYQASVDDMLSRDGVGDEVYVAAYVRNYDRRSGQMASVETRTSAVHGDVNKFGAQRLQAGTRSGTGGIQDGDMIPEGAFIATRSVAAQDVTFPMRIFEGTLTDGVDALLISPSIWEQDVTNSFFQQWQQNQATLNLSLFAKAGVHAEIADQSFKPLKFGMSSHDSLTGATSVVHFFTDAMIMFGGGGVPIIGLLSASADRPLGLHENGRDQTALPNHVIVLTREIIEAALARPAIGPIPSPVANGFPGQGLMSTPAIARVGVIAPKPGVMVLQFEDRNVSGMLAFPERPAIYQMYVQVERVP